MFYNILTLLQQIMTHFRYGQPSLFIERLKNRKKLASRNCFYPFYFS